MPRPRSQVCMVAASTSKDPPRARPDHSPADASRSPQPPHPDQTAPTHHPPHPPTRHPPAPAPHAPAHRPPPARPASPRQFPHTKTRYSPQIRNVTLSLTPTISQCETRPMADWLRGTWKLNAWRRIAEDGTVTYPLGPDARGQLIYTDNGGM